ncbi:two-component sensor histidine kinase [Fulvivirga sp. M361]|uniref:sensor histidine kinase n=1 Tax=Fulvivirga sp. M361 TaxID=2594266 RepID=UPI00117AB306|nr:ATP-binding protein [Fulvivirga sp. M361]TRX56230.1 two-component sensor histidine kinase [Fulvivirga sp. M361]
MVFSSRTIALLLALCIAAITTAFLSLFEEVTQSALLVAFCISGSVSYLLGFIVLEFLIFREINKIYSLFDKLRKKELKTIETERSNPFNPLKRINEEIFSYASLKQKEIDELKKIEAFRREFIADVSHELKTPIFAAQGFVHTLLDGAVKDKNVRTRFLKKAAKSLDGLDILVQDLLTLSQIETGEIKMHFEYFDILQMAVDTMEQFENKADKKDIILEFAGEKPDRVRVYGDWRRINQVFTNLISNAIKYSNEGDHVWVEFDVQDDFVVTKVRDIGEGIPEEDIGRIFERFYRVDKSRSREKGGTGLGLAIVKHIIEGHNSKVEVKSVPGEGSEFSFKLPKAKDEDPALEDELEE